MSNRKAPDDFTKSRGYWERDFARSQELRRGLAKRVAILTTSIGEVHLRATRYGGQPSRGLPTVAHADVGRRERRLVAQTGASWNRLTGWLRRVEALRAAA